MGMITYWDFQEPWSKMAQTIITPSTALDVQLINQLPDLCISLVKEPVVLRELR